jgi:glycosyltransferase involved in cell wall biosynthesis
VAIAVATVRRLHRVRRLDLIHGLWVDEAGAVATAAGRLLGLPAMASILGGELAAIPEAGYGAALGRGGRWTTRFTLASADLVTVGSAAAFREVALRIPGTPLRLAPLGVDLDHFRPAPADESRAAPLTVLFAGALTPVKDPVTAIRAFARSPDETLIMDVVGDGPLRPGLERLCARLGLVDRVRFLGNVPRGDLAARYQAAATLLVTSHHEAQCMVAVEAAACGTPIVGTRVGVLPELERGGAALTASVGDVTGVADILARVATDRPLRSAMGASAAAHARHAWALDRSIARFETAWRDLAIRRS